MNYFSSLHLIVYGFLLLTLIVGLYSGRNVKTFKDYATANKSLGTGVLTMTFLATMVSASWLQRISYTYVAGPYEPLTQSLLLATAFLLAGKYLPKKLIRFSQCYTAPQVMGQLYGDGAKKFIAFLSLVIAIFSIAAQLAFMGKVVAPLIGFSYKQMVWIIGGAIIIYSTAGGMRAVAVTDLLQLIALIVTTSLLAYKVTALNSGIGPLLAKIKAHHAPQLDLSGYLRGLHFGGFSLILVIFFWSIFGYLMPPPQLQRMLISKDQEGIRHMFFSAAVFTPVLFCAFIVIGLGILVLHPGLARGQVIPTLLTTLFSNILARGTVTIGTMAVVMSTMDSFLHSAAVTLVSDILFPKKNFDKSETKHLRLIQGVAFFLGIGALLVASIWETSLYLTYAGVMLFSFCLLPLIGGLVGLKTSRRDFWIAFAAAFLVEGIGLLIMTQLDRELWYSGVKDTVWLFAILTNILTYFASHYLRNGGIVWGDNSGQAASPWKPSWGSFQGWLASFLPTPANARTFVKYTIFSNQEGYVLSFFLCLNYLVPFFMSTRIGGEDFTSTLMVLKATAALLCTGLMAHTIWPNNLKRRLYDLYWLLTITFCLPFMATFVFLLDGGSTLTIFNIMLAIMLLVSIVNWKGFVTMSAWGIGTAWLLYHLLHGPVQLQLNIDDAFLLAYALVFSLLIGGLFVRKTAQHSAHSILHQQMLGGTLGHELSGSVGLMLPMSQTLKTIMTMGVQPSKEAGEGGICMTKANYATAMHTIADLEGKGRDAQEQIKVFSMMIKEDISGVPRSVYAVNTLMKSAYHRSDPNYNEKTRLVLEQGKDFDVWVPRVPLENVVMNLMKNAVWHGAAQEVEVVTDAKMRTIEVRDNGKGIPAEKLPYIFRLYYSKGSGGQGIGLPFVKSAIEQMGGTIALVANRATGGAFTTFRITLPRVEEVKEEN